MELEKTQTARPGLTPEVKINSLKAKPCAVTLRPRQGAELQYKRDLHTNIIHGVVCLQGCMRSQLTESTLQARGTHRIITYAEKRSLFLTVCFVFQYFAVTP